MNTIRETGKRLGGKLVWMGLGVIAVAVEALLALMLVSLFLDLQMPGKENLVFALFWTLIALGAVLFSAGLYFRRQQQTTS